MRRLGREELPPLILMFAGGLLLALSMMLVYSAIKESGQMIPIGFLMVIGGGLIFYGYKKWKDMHW